MAFQENLRYYREKAGYKQAKEFAKILGITYTTYIGYENKGREPKYSTLCKIADLLNISTDELLGRENNILGDQDDEQLKKELGNILGSSEKKYLKVRECAIQDDSIELCICDENEDVICFMDYSRKKIVHLINNTKKIYTKKTLKHIYRELLFTGIEYNIKEWSRSKKASEDSLIELKKDEPQNAIRLFLASQDILAGTEIVSKLQQLKNILLEQSSK